MEDGVARFAKEKRKRGRGEGNGRDGHTYPNQRPHRHVIDVHLVPVVVLHCVLEGLELGRVQRHVAELLRCNIVAKLDVEAAELELDALLALRRQTPDPTSAS